jgi:chromosome segregation ATPase
MSEQEKREQIGKLAEEYSEVKGKLIQLGEKLSKAHSDYQLLGQAQNFNNLRIDGGKLVFQAAPSSQRALENLLNSSQLVELLTERDRLNGELKEISERLKALAPHLL